jgi:hypothetical protein
MYHSTIRSNCNHSQIHQYHLVFQHASKNSIAKDGWGSRANFQASCRLKMTPEEYDSGGDAGRGHEEVGMN